MYTVLHGLRERVVLSFDSEAQSNFHERMSCSARSYVPSVVHAHRHVETYIFGLCSKLSKFEGRIFRVFLIKRYD